MSFAAEKPVSGAPTRFQSRVIEIGSLKMGGNFPVLIQSMTTTDTMDIEGTVKQCRDLFDAGCELVRITAPTVPDAEALKSIREKLNQQGYKGPLSADIHFVPAAAMTAAEYVEKVRINPGNFADHKLFKTREFTDDQYQEELERIHDKFKPLVMRLKTLGRALRIGTNHGSLSDRIMNRFGDTPEGMVESAFEFAEICRLYDFHNFCFSMKASNVQVMVRAYRLLVERQRERDWDYPLHLGVTEAGDGEDGRLKSAIGIGTLLAEGMGDTIRVSLTESPVKEVPVARTLSHLVPRTAPVRSGHYEILPNEKAGGALPQVWMRVKNLETLKRDLESTKLRPDVLYIDELEEIENEFHLLKLQLKAVFGSSPFEIAVKQGDWQNDERLSRRILTAASIVVGRDLEIVSGVDALQARSAFDPQKVILQWDAPNLGDSSVLQAGIEVGSAFVDLNLRGVMIDSTSADEGLRLAYGILQATRRRMSKTEYISCPSCGRTLFDLEETTARIKSVTDHLVGVKIAVMGCIVNGPGEMADADFGYVGGAPGKVNLYVGKDCVERNIVSEEAPQRLVELIKRNNRWQEPKL